MAKIDIRAASKTVKRQIKYKKGYKYILWEEYSEQTPIKPKTDIHLPFVTLTKEGVLTLRKYYACDGPSGPTFDTDTFMRGAFKHDAFAQLMRHGLLSRKWRKRTDKYLVHDCKIDGMIWVRRQWVYRGVRIGGGNSVKAKSIRKVLVAPK